MSVQISLLIPCYNAENYIDNFIRHLNEADLKFDEVIFYNDGSEDNTLEILKKSGYKYFSSTTNYGPGYARNRLAEAATGEYIHFHDVDDEFNPNFLKLIKTEINVGHPEIIVGYADWVDQATRNTVIEWRYDHNEIQNDALAYFITHPLGIINTVYNKDCFLSIHGFNEELHCWEDADLHVRLAAEKFSFIVIPQVIAYSIRHNSGISNNQENCWNCRLKFLDAYINLYSTVVNKQVFKIEVKKVQTAFVNSGAYILLINIIRANKKYGLGLKTGKIKYIYYLNKYILPTFVIEKLLNRYNLANQWK